MKINNDDRDSLNAMKDEYLKPSPDRIVDQKVIMMVAKYVISRLPGSRILELGVGDQVWTPMLLEKFKDVTTIDGSNELLQAMQQRLAGKPWTPIVSYFEDYEPKQKFDTVLATYVLEHVDDPLEILKLVNRKWLKPGGTLAVVVPHALSLHRRWALAMGMVSHLAELSETDYRVGHKRCFTCHEMEKLIVQAGFRIVERKGMFSKPFPNSMLVNCSDKQLQGLYELGLELPIEYSATIYFRAEPV